MLTLSITDINTKVKTQALKFAEFDFTNADNHFGIIVPIILQAGIFPHEKQRPKTDAVYTNILYMAANPPRSPDELLMLSIASNLL